MNRTYLLAGEKRGEKLDLENDKVEALIEAVLDWADSTNDLRLAVKDILKK